MNQKKNNLIESVATDKHKKYKIRNKTLLTSCEWKLLAFYRHFGLCYVLFRKVITIKLNRYTNINILNQLDSEYIYRKIPKRSPWAYIFQRPFLRGLSTEGNLRFKIDWASHIVRRKFTVFALFYFCIWGQFRRARGAYIWRGHLTEGSLRYEFGGLIVGGAYFRNFTVL